MNWLYYLLEANLYLAIFYAVYYLLLRRETFYQLNRVYLLISCAVAFLLPMMQLGILKPAYTRQPVNEAVNYQIIAQPLHQAQVVIQSEQPHLNYYLLIYSIIAGLLLLHFGYKVFKLIQLARKNNCVDNGDHQLIEIDDEVPAFSFFQYLFINQKLSGSATIIRHELVHIRQRHSWDVIYLELVKIICWFNPVVYLLQNSLKELHEYIADEQINYTRQDINNYTDFLLSAAYGTHATTLTNNFFNKNLLKKRIMMLHQKRSGYLARLKYLAVVPALGGMLCVSTLAFSKSYEVVDLLPRKTELKAISTANKPIRYEINPANYSAKYLKKLTADFKKEGYILKVNEIKTGNKVTSLAVELATAASVTWHVQVSATFDIEGLKQSNAIIAVGSKPEIQQLFVRSETTKSNTLAKSTPATNADTQNASVKNISPLPQPTVEKTQSAKQDPETILSPVDTLTPINLDNLYRYIAKNTRYPRVARDNNVGGVVFIAFAINNDKKLDGLKILRSPSKSLSDELVRVMQSCDQFTDLKSGITYTISVHFNVLNAEEKNVGINTDETIDQAHYAVGNKIDTDNKMIALNQVVVLSYAAK